MFKDFDFSKMGEMLAQAQQKAKEFEDESAAKTYGAKSGGGFVSVQVNGANEVLDISIDDSLLDDKESLQILLISAINDALKAANDDKKAMASRMLGGFGGLNL